MKYFLLIILLPLSVYPQSIDHWETVVFDDDIWKYFQGVSEPDTNWRKLAFNDMLWQQGVGGIGYGDSDDNVDYSQYLTAGPLDGYYDNVLYAF